jgi:phage terminase small subunit
MPPLKGKSKIFVDEYLVDQNATQAAIRAGYSKKTAYAIGQKLLKKAVIASAVQKEMDARAKRVQFTADDVLRELRNISDADISECYNKDGSFKLIHEIPLHIRKAIAGIEVKELFDWAEDARTGRRKKKKIGEVVKVKFWDKTKTLELTGRHLKLFTDKLEHTGKDGEPLPQNAPQVIVMLPPKNKTPSDDGGENG